MLFKYNQSKSVLYARNYVKEGNPFYKSFSSEFEDCNFISQCIVAGAEMSPSSICDQWFYENEIKYSPSWINREELLKFLLSSNKCGPSGRLVNLANLTAGDLVFLEKKSQIVMVGIVTKIENEDLFFISKSASLKEEKLKHCDDEKEYFVHIVGVKK